MPMMTAPSLCIGAKPTLFLPPNQNHFPCIGNSRKCTRVAMQLQPWSQRKFSPVKAVISCNSGLNAKCSQTQTLTRETPTITQTPNIGKSPKIDDGGIKLDDGGNGFPPRDGGGGGGGGGGGEKFSGGFFLFGFLMFMGYLKDLEEEPEKSY